MDIKILIMKLKQLLLLRYSFSFRIHNIKIISIYINPSQGSTREIIRSHKIKQLFK